MRKHEGGVSDVFAGGIAKNLRFGRGFTDVVSIDEMGL